MAGINQGRPETAIGEPIRLGSNNDFELEQHPVSDRLIIRDTVNGKVAYVRKERGGQIGGDGVLIEALKEGKPMADDGRTYDTIQQAESKASSWVFVPPGTYSENIKVDTGGLTIRGSGYNTLVSGNDLSPVINIQQSDVTISNLSIEQSGAGTADCIFSDSLTENTSVTDVTIRDSAEDGIQFAGDNCRAINVTIESAGRFGVYVPSSSSGNIVNGCTVASTGGDGIRIQGDDNISTNNVVRSTSTDCIESDGSNNLIGGNRLINAGDIGIRVSETNNLIFNNRVSDSTSSDISDGGTGTLLDANLTGGSN